MKTDRNGARVGQKTDTVPDGAKTGTKTKSFPRVTFQRLSCDP